MVVCRRARWAHQVRGANSQYAAPGIGASSRSSASVSWPHGTWLLYVNQSATPAGSLDRNVLVKAD